MAASIASGAASNVIAKLLEYATKGAVSQIAPYFGGRRKLKELEQTMEMIQARLVDAERRGDGENEELVKRWLKRLKRVLYQLEDLLEETAMDNMEKDQLPGGKLTKPFRLLFSLCIPLKINKKVAEGVKTIMKELETITSVMNSLNFRQLTMKEQGVVDVHSIRETHSFALEEEVIGRDEDKNKIVNMLLDSVMGRENVSVIPIIGIGGLGKTTLTQLIFNDEDVRNHFDVRYWTCISDISSLHELARKVLTSISRGDYHQSTLEEIQSRLRQAVNEKRYLLVLDDIWDEDRNRWLELRSLLSGGKQGSKIIVTSRSKIVAQNMGTVEPIELKGLSDDKSWDLFKSLAFKEGQEEEDPYRAGIGRDIVKKCANVPLAIKTIASLLYSMDTDREWEAFKDKDLAMIKQNENNILLTLKLSYDRLPSELKQCFAYCSLFPKDEVLSKQELSSLWMAQGFLGSSSGEQSLEDVGHEYFMQLMRRCFFQDAICDEFGEIISCKMHDIMHDLAQLVAEGEILLVDEATQKIGDDILHVSFCTSLVETPSSRLRSFLSLDLYEEYPNLGKVVSSLKSLRALHLTYCDSLPDSLGELKHLRYLKLGGYLNSLPECITRLQNLQTLDVQCCHKLAELPGGFSQLINLRHLHLFEEGIDEMPPGLGQLTSLRALNLFVVGKRYGLNELVTLYHLVGPLTINFREHRINALSDTTGGILRSTKVTDLELQWNYYGGSGEEEKFESEVRCLQPPPSLRSLKVKGWEGVRFPSWGMDELPSLLPHLVKIVFEECRRCQHLPSFSQLRHLKTLKLLKLDALEYIESNGGNNREASSPSAARQYYFPSLESLELGELPKLKGWSRSEEEDTASIILHHHAPLLPRLSCLKIYDCGNLTLVPLAPRLETLEVSDIHRKLIKHLLHGKQESELQSKSISPTTSNLPHSSYLSSLRDLEIRSAYKLESLSMNNLCSLESLKIMICPNLINVTVVSSTSMSSLRTLEIQACGKLRDISGLRQNLCFLNKLRIVGCPEVDLGDLIDDDDGVCHTLQSLRSLELICLRALPESIGRLTQLRQLEIEDCRELTAIPESFGNLVSLQKLIIDECPALMALPESFGSLVSVQELQIFNCLTLVVLPNSFGNLASLLRFEICQCPALTALPESIGNLASLQTLKLEDCPTLTALPESFCNLSSLLSLKIWRCPELKRRCEKPDGQDWPLIQHIPNVEFFRC